MDHVEAQRHPTNTISLGGVTLEEVESFKCMGSSFTAIGQAEDEISGRIDLVRNAFARLKSALWFGRVIALKIKSQYLRGIYPDDSALRLRDVACAC